jgi:hypothetical protein
MEREEKERKRNVLGKSTPPFQESVTLPSLKLDRRHLPRPRRPTRHLKALDVLPLSLVELLLLLRSEEVGVGDDLDVLAFYRGGWIS